MAYRITYAWQKEENMIKRTGHSPVMVLSVAILCAALLLRLLIPQSEQVFRELLYPLGDEYTVSAFADMVEQIGEGTPVSEAVTAFCREIIENGT